MPLKELIAAKAGPIVTTQVQNFLVRVEAPLLLMSLSPTGVVPPLVLAYG